MLNDTFIIMEYNNYTRMVPLANSFGKVYPSLISEFLADMLNISPDERVLDIGGGADPFYGASVVVEPHLENASHRSGENVLPDVDYVQCFAENLSFRDKAFDVAVSRQVFEHVNSPNDACREMMRVARRGFIETPRKIYELISGPNPSHQWFVSVADGALVFERRMFVRHPLRHLGLGTVPSSKEGQLLIHGEYRNLSCVQFYWEGGFDYRVVDSGEGFDYSNPLHASEAHLDVAICSLLHGGHYLTNRECDAREALRLRPGWDLAHNTLGVILWKQGRLEEAGREFTLAAETEPRDEYLYNLKLEPTRGEPLIVDFDYTLPEDEKFFRRYTNCGAFDTAGYLYGRHCK